MGQWSVWGIVVGLVLMVAGGAAGAQEVGVARNQVEISLMVRGSITVHERGDVADYALHAPDKLPASVVQFVRTTIDGWVFEPVRRGGEPVRFRGGMNLLLVAREVEDGDFLMRLQAASFTAESGDSQAVATSGLKAPRYPEEAARDGVQGTVYLILKVGRDGRVLDVIAEQVNLRVQESGKKMAELRKVLADASIKAARKWEFAPMTGADGDAAFQSIRVPVDFNMGEQPSYGGWIAYIPGPRRKADWVDEELAGDSPEAMTAGTPRRVGKEGLRLLAPSLSKG